MQRVERRLSILTICRGESTRSVVQNAETRYKRREVLSQKIKKVLSLV